MDYRYKEGCRKDDQVRKDRTRLRKTLPGTACL